MATPALQEAISHAPQDPWRNGKFFGACNKIVGSWTINNPILSSVLPDAPEFKQRLEEFPDIYQGLIEGLGPDDKNKVDAALAAYAITLANIPEPQLRTDHKARLEAYAGTTYGRFLLEEPTMGQTRKETWDTIFQLQPDVRTIIEAKPVDKTVQATRKETPFDESIMVELRSKAAILIDAIHGPISMRQSRAIVEDLRAVARSMGCENPEMYIHDFSLGDERYTDTLEEGFEHVTERLGLGGYKLRLIKERELVYEELLTRAGIPPYEYDSRAVGLPAIRDWFQKYLEYFGLNGYIRGGDKYLQGKTGETDGSYVAYGGADAMERAYLIARRAIREERRASGIPDAKTYQPTIAFTTPSFMMMEKLASNIELNTVQIITSPKNHFLPTEEQFERFLEARPEVDIVDPTMINNPGSYIAPEELVRDIINVLERFRGKGRVITMINDFAYLGTGDIEANKRMCRELNRWKRRYDIMPLTKLAGETGGRYAAGFTPDPDLAKYCEMVTQEKTLAISWKMQLRLLAKLDYLSIEDIFEAMKLARYRQETATRLFAESGLFDPDSIYPGYTYNQPLDRKYNNWGNAAKYLYAGLSPGHSARDLMKRLIFGTEPGAFYLAGTPVGINEVPDNYVRFALMRTAFTKQKIEWLRRALDLPIAA